MGGKESHLSKLKNGLFLIGRLQWSKFPYLMFKKGEMNETTKKVSHGRKIGKGECCVSCRVKNTGRNAERNKDVTMHYCHIMSKLPSLITQTKNTPPYSSALE